jgi:hypothetical protein
MNPLRTPTALAAALVALLGGVLLTGCQDRDFGLSIRQVQPIDSSACLVDTDEGNFQSSGVVDLALRNGYTIHPLIQNNMQDINEIKQFENTDGRINTNAILLRSASIEYTALDTLSAQITSPTVVALSGTVPVGDLLVVGVEVLNSAVLSQLRDADEFLLIDDSGQARPIRSSVKIIARLRIEGETLDGKKVESNEFLFPIEVCNGCRISYPAPLLEQRGGVLTCPSVTLDAEGNPIVQDEDEDRCPAASGVENGFVDCQECQGLAVDSFARQLCQPPTGN